MALVGIVRLWSEAGMGYPERGAETPKEFKALAVSLPLSKE